MQLNQQSSAALSAPDAPDVPESDEFDSPELVLWARDVQITGSQGIAVDGLDVDLPAGGLCILQGPDGSGKTSALLALAGRMRVKHGSIEVAGRSLPRHRGAVQHDVSLAEVTGVNDLDDALTVVNHIAERLASQTLLPWASRAPIQAVMDSYTSALVAARRYAPAQSPRSEVAPDGFVGDLTGVERTLLGVTLALIGSPAVVAIDENGELRSREDRRAATAGVGYLMRAARTPFAVLATSTEAVDVEAVAEITGLSVSLIRVTDLGRDAERLAPRIATLPLADADAAPSPTTTPEPGGSAPEPHVEVEPEPGAEPVRAPEGPAESGLTAAHDIATDRPSRQDAEIPAETGVDSDLDDSAHDAPKANR